LQLRWIVLGIVAIIVGTFAFEYYAQTRYPEEQLVITGVDVSIGETYVYTFFRNNENLGNHSYTVISEEGSGSSTVYMMKASTVVTSNGKTLDLEGRYIFNQKYLPINYHLNATQGGNLTIIDCAFYDGKVNTTVTEGGNSITLQKDLPEGTLLLENTMPAYWEVLFHSTSLDQGKRYKAEMYVPQYDKIISISLFVDPNKIKQQLGDSTVDATVVTLSDLNLTFYLYNGELITYRDDSQGILLQKVY
jgi:hypothetical protein